MFYRLPAQSFGSFVSPQRYPGPTTTITFEKGGEQVSVNRAILRRGTLWSQVSDGDSFYSTFVDASTGRTERRDISLKMAPYIPERVQQSRQSPDDGSADTPLGFPEPYITGPTDVYVNGFFMDGPNTTNLAILSLQTFNTKTDSEARRFQLLVQQFLAEAKSRGSTKVIIDLQSNPGGRVFLGYDTFLQVGYFPYLGRSTLTLSQFFPNIEPFGGTRYRGHDSANIFGTELSRLSFSQSGKIWTFPHTAFETNNN
jgi:hypothetical protein